MHGTTVKNMKEVLRYVSKFVNENKGVNIVLINSPHVHDLTLSLCVNKEVVKFNRQVKKDNENSFKCETIRNRSRQETLY